MKKILVLILVTVMLCGLLVGCTEDVTDTSSTESTVTSSDVTSSDETSSEETLSGEVSSDEASSDTSSEPSTSTKVYNQYLKIFTSFSDEYPLDIDTVISHGVGEVTQSDRYLTERDEEYGMWRKYTVPEADMLTALRKIFVITDEFWESIKEHEIYNLGANDCNYMDGNFYITKIDGWGGAIEEMFMLRKVIDDNNGTLTLYYLYLYEQIEQHYIEVTYTYSGRAEYQIEEDPEHYGAGMINSLDEAFIKSLRVKSIKKVHNFPGNTEAQRQYHYLYGESTYYFYWYENDPEHIELYGCGGEFDLPCSCGEPGLCENWHFGAANKMVTCPCGATVMTELFIEAPVYR